MACGSAASTKPYIDTTLILTFCLSVVLFMFQQSRGLPLREVTSENRCDVISTKLL
ncbi:hypothetical protein KC19_10G053600 [Ceratodon purpureus]|uniref:Uncharacterized protein n=1 Tax=Ceratodon purpureus TaxID=3225 RepID=A0A8T0GJR3_CERPU|nr:hypothetical protein KC19_10G053600 [Ceratodon purpureus]